MYFQLDLKVENPQIPFIDVRTANRKIEFFFCKEQTGLSRLLGYPDQVVPRLFSTGNKIRRKG